MGRLAEIKKRLEECSQYWFAEWNWENTTSIYTGEDVYTAWSEGPTLKGKNLDELMVQARKDKEFIAHAVDDVRFMLGEIELLREKIEELNEELEQIKEDFWDG